MRGTTRFLSLRFAFLYLIASAPVASGQPPAKLAHGTCSANLGGTTYFSAAFSAPFEKDPRGAEPSYHTMVTWGRVFADYVKQKYGDANSSASGSCALVASLEQAQAGLKVRVAGANQMLQKVVETDWVLKSATPSTPPSAQPATSAARTPPPNASAQGNTMQAVCWSDLNAPVIYVSQVFDTQMGRPDQGVDLFSPVSNEFHQYLKGRYDYKTSATRGAHCAGQLSQAASSAQRSRVMTEFATGKRVVELEWQFSPDTATVTPGVSVALDGGYCVSPGVTGTVYTAGPVDLKGRMSTHEWNRGFTQFLAGKYALKGDAECQIGMPRVRAQRWFSFHVQGARAGNKKVVETGWELGAAPSSQAAAPNAADDRAPARPAAPAATPSQEVRAFATKEVPEIMAYCQNDKTLRALNCQMVQRAIYNYRMAHAADATPEPFAVLLTGDKLDCSGCVDGRLTGWAKQQVSAASLTQDIAECVGQRIVPLFQAKPYANRIKEAYDAALAACRR